MVGLKQAGPIGGKTEGELGCGLTHGFRPVCGEGGWKGRWALAMLGWIGQAGGGGAVNAEEAEALPRLRCRGRRERDLALASPGDGPHRAELCKAATDATNWRRFSGGLARGEVNTGVRGGS